MNTTMNEERLVAEIRRHYEAARHEACCQVCLWEGEAFASDRRVWAAAGITAPPQDSDDGAHACPSCDEGRVVDAW